MACAIAIFHSVAQSNAVCCGGLLTFCVLLLTLSQSHVHVHRRARAHIQQICRLLHTQFRCFSHSLFFIFIISRQHRCCLISLEWVLNSHHLCRRRYRESHKIKWKISLQFFRWLKHLFFVILIFTHNHTHVRHTSPYLRPSAQLTQTCERVFIHFCFSFYSHFIFVLL